MSSHGDEPARRRSAHQPPRVVVLLTVTTKYGDPFLPTEFGLLINAFHRCGAAMIGVGINIAVADFRFRAANPKRAALHVAERFPRPTAGTAVQFIAFRPGVDKPEYVADSEGWPDKLPELPDPDKLQYHWKAPAADNWQVL